MKLSRKRLSKRFYGIISIRLKQPAKTFVALSLTLVFLFGLISFSSSGGLFNAAPAADAFAGIHRPPKTTRPKTTRPTTTTTRPTGTTATTSFSTAVTTSSETMTVITTSPTVTEPTTAEPTATTSTTTEEETVPTATTTETSAIEPETSATLPPLVTLTTTERETVMFPSDAQMSTTDGEANMPQYFNLYAALLRSYTDAYGQTRSGSVYGGSYSSGVVFGDLLDLNDDGIFELFIGYSPEASGKDGRNDIIDIYTVRNGSVVRVASVRPRHTYGTDTYTYLYLTEIDGYVFLRTDDSSEAGYVQMTFYLYDGSRVDSSTVTASARTDSKGKITYSSFRLDSATISASEFGKILVAPTLPFNLNMAERDYRLNPNRLMNFLDGNSASYQTLLVNATDYESKPVWANAYAPKRITNYS